MHIELAPVFGMRRPPPHGWSGSLSSSAWRQPSRRIALAGAVTMAGSLITGPAAHRPLVSGHSVPCGATTGHAAAPALATVLSVLTQGPDPMSGAVWR